VSAVIDEVIAVPSSAPGAHLGQPSPDVMGRAMNGDGVIDRANGLGNQVVSGKGLGYLARCSVDLHAPVSRKCHEDRQSPRKYDQYLFPHELADRNAKR